MFRFQAAAKSRVAEALRRIATQVETASIPPRVASHRLSRVKMALSQTATEALTAMRDFQANSREEVIKGFKSANPDLTDEQLEGIADQWEKNKDVVKDQHKTASLKDALMAFDMTLQTARAAYKAAVRGNERVACIQGIGTVFNATSCLAILAPEHAKNLNDIGMKAMRLLPVIKAEAVEADIIKPGDKLIGELFGVTVQTAQQAARAASAGNERVAVSKSLATALNAIAAIVRIAPEHANALQQLSAKLYRLQAAIKSEAIAADLLSQEPEIEWDYEGYWNAVIGPNRGPDDVVREFDLRQDGLDEWLGTAEEASISVSAGGLDRDSTLEAWEQFHKRALMALEEVIEREGDSGEFRGARPMNHSYRHVTIQGTRCDVCRDCGHPIVPEGCYIPHWADTDQDGEDRPRCSDTACSAQLAGPEVIEREGDSGEFITNDLKITRIHEILDNGASGDARVALCVGRSGDGNWEPFLKTNGGPILIDLEGGGGASSTSLEDAADSLGMDPDELRGTIEREMD